MEGISRQADSGLKQKNTETTDPKDSTRDSTKIAARETFPALNMTYNPIIDRGLQICKVLPASRKPSFF